MSHHPRVMLTVTGGSLAKGRQERPAQQAGELAFGRKGRRPCHSGRMATIAGRKNRFLCLCNQCPNTERWKQGPIRSNRPLVARQLLSNQERGLSDRSAHCLSNQEPGP